MITVKRFCGIIPLVLIFALLVFAQEAQTPQAKKGAQTSNTGATTANTAAPAPNAAQATVTTTGTVTTGRIAKFASASTITNSVITERTGKIGIGTATPVAPLTVVGNWNGQDGALRLNGDKPTIRFAGSSVSGSQSWIIHQGSNGPGNLEFFRRTGTSWGQVMSLTPTGNVGIGTTTPTAKLYVLVPDENGVEQALHARSNAFNGVGGLFEAYGGNVPIAVWGMAPTSNCSGCYAGAFEGDVNITGTLHKAAGTFRIDHPLDPANKTLSHSFVESPDMMNIYNGNITLDPSGEAVVVMPRWFNALNKEFRYQLTAIGAPGPNLHIAEEVKGNHFRIAGGTPGMQVSWQVTGIRHDAYAEAHRIQVEEEKPEKERGYYLHPELFKQPEEKGINWARRPELMKQMKEQREQEKEQNQSVQQPNP